MRALTALLLIAVHANAAKHEVNTDLVENFIVNALKDISGSDTVTWPGRLVKCTRTLGIKKCVKAFNAWRAENAENVLARSNDVQFDIQDELERFPLEEFANDTEEELDARLASATLRVLDKRSVTIPTISGISIEMGCTQNGTVNLDIYKNNEVGTARGKGSKLQKQFYAIVPYLLVPPLIMSAILPFVLPAMKMMTVGVGILNQMALMGSIFTLLRNNAFNDKYEKKVIYVNEGYKNEPKLPVYEEEGQYFHSDEHLGKRYSKKPNSYEEIYKYKHPEVYGNEYAVEELPPEWANQDAEESEYNYRYAELDDRNSRGKHKSHLKPKSNLN